MAATSTQTPSSRSRKPARRTRARPAKATFGSSINDAISGMATSPRMVAAAGKQVSTASAAVIKWGKKHPAQATAAAVALIAAAKALQVVMRKRSAG